MKRASSGAGDEGPPASSCGWRVGGYGAGIKTTMHKAGGSLRHGGQGVHLTHKLSWVSPGSAHFSREPWHPEPERFLLSSPRAMATGLWCLPLARMDSPCHPSTKANLTQAASASLPSQEGRPERELLKGAALPRHREGTHQPFGPKAGQPRRSWACSLSGLQSLRWALLFFSGRGLCCCCCRRQRS